MCPRIPVILKSLVHSAIAFFQETFSRWQCRLLLTEDVLRLALLHLPAHNQMATATRTTKVAASRDVRVLLRPEKRDARETHINLSALQSLSPPIYYEPTMLMRAQDLWRPAESEMMHAETNTRQAMHALSTWITVDINGSGRNGYFR